VSLDLHNAAKLVLSGLAFDVLILIAGLLLLVKSYLPHIP